MAVDTCLAIDSWGCFQAYGKKAKSPKSPRRLRTAQANPRRSEIHAAGLGEPDETIATLGPEERNRRAAGGRFGVSGLVCRVPERPAPGPSTAHQAGEVGHLAGNTLLAWRRASVIVLTPTGTPRRRFPPSFFNRSAFFVLAERRFPPPTSNRILRCTKRHQEQNAAQPPCGLLRNIFFLTPFRSAGEILLLRGGRGKNARGEFERHNQTNRACKAAGDCRKRENSYRAPVRRGEGEEILHYITGRICTTKDDKSTHALQSI